ncbi:17048_t:CDS:2, partial [Acaulospora morrowiae]
IDSQDSYDEAPFGSAIYSKQISDSLMRQSQYYQDMSALFSTIEFAPIEPDSDDEVVTMTNASSSKGTWRSSRARTKISYNYPRYSYSSSKRPKTRRKKLTT